MGKAAALSSVGTIAMQKVPTDGDLVWVVPIHTSKATAACTCSGEARAWFVNVFQPFGSSTSLSGRPSIVESQISIPQSVTPRGYL